MKWVKKACVSSSAIPSRWSTQPSRVTLMLKVRPMAASLSLLRSRSMPASSNALEEPVRKGRRSRDCCHQTRSQGSGGRQKLSLRPVLSARRVSDRCAAAPRSSDRHSFLVEYFVHRLANRARKKVRRIENATLQLLCTYP